MARGKRRQLTVPANPRQQSEYKEAFEVFEALKEAGVRTATASYYGGGDDHDVNEIKLEPAVAGEEGERLSDRVGDAVYGLLNVADSGWDQEEGSSGEATFNVLTGTVAFDHHVYEEGTSQSVANFSFADLEKMHENAKAEENNIYHSWQAQALASILNLINGAREAGVKTLTVTYNGGGDSGQVEDVELEPATATLSANLENSVSQAAMTVVSLQRSGWENNRGGYGEVVFDLDDEEVRLAHSDYQVESKEAPFDVEGFVPFEVVKVNRGPRTRQSALAS